VKKFKAHSVFQGKRKFLNNGKKNGETVKNFRKRNPERWKAFQYSVFNLSVYSFGGDPCNLG